MTAHSVHIPVMVAPLVSMLVVNDSGVYVDATLGLGGHSEALLQAIAPAGRVIGFEWDRQAARQARQLLRQFGDRFQLVPASYTELEQALRNLGVEAIDGLLLDLGVSSLQLDTGERGFSFREDGPLDMRMNHSLPVTAADLLQQLSAAQLSDIFFRYGEERQARRIARHLVQARQRQPIRTTSQLAALVAEAVPRRFHPRRINVATRVFQALRIAVNRELDNLDQILTTAPRVLRSGGRLAVITFHSLEDRMVKHHFGHHTCWRPVTRKPVLPAEAEVAANPRARSARMRVAERS